MTPSTPSPAPFLQSQVIAHAEMREIALLKARRNARRHDQEQLDLIVKSMREFGWTTAVLVDEQNTVLAGYGRVEAAKILGLMQVPVVVANGWSEAQKKAYMLADNQIAMRAGWDEALLKLELDDLKLMDFDVSLIGFDKRDMVNLASFGQLERPVGNLRDDFILPPFSVIDSRTGWWQKRRRAWIELGIQSELGRGDNTLKFSDTIREPSERKRDKRGGSETPDLRGGLTHRITTDAYRKYGEPL